MLVVVFVGLDVAMAAFTEVLCASGTVDQWSVHSGDGSSGDELIGKLNGRVPEVGITL
jgi:hypothetical protein